MSRITKVRLRALHVGQTVSFNCADLSIQQNFAPTWSEEQAYGKMDPIAAYSHTAREINVNFVLLALTLNEAAVQQRKIDKLIKFQYPKYTTIGRSGQTLSGAPFFQLSVLSGMMYSPIRGYMTAITINPGSSEDIVPLVSNSNDLLYERKYTVDFTMKVLHKETPGWLGTVEPGGNGNSFVFRAQRGRPGRPSQTQNEQAEENSGAAEGVQTNTAGDTSNMEEVAQQEGRDSNDSAQAVGTENGGQS